MNIMTSVGVKLTLWCENHIG